jgi:hypothetical protein
MTKYARDEFDRVPETSSRQGVHRAASGPARRGLAPILTVGIAALAVGLAFLLLPKLGFSLGDPLSLLSGSSAAAAASGPSPSAEGTVGDAGASATGSPRSSPSASPLATTSVSGSPTPESSVPVVDKTQPVAVYNGTRTAGLAGRVAERVQAAGWALGPVGNWGGLPQQTSVIFYKGEAEREAAAALGTLLNITTLVDSAEFQLPLVVVLGPGYQ